jgi:hypothetical protein
MVKTNTPATVKIAGITEPFKTDALPDPFDSNDLVYRPRLQVLPQRLDQRANEPILAQQGGSCTGHAVASLISTVLSTEPTKRPARGAPRKVTRLVSPYMLYALARRYDEFPGNEDIGSSLRGAFKGWSKHGVCRSETWPFGIPDPDLSDPAFLREASEVPLGAYYRVNVQRIDDLQSAISELNAIAVSAAVHDGWTEPKPFIDEKNPKSKKPIWVIDRTPDNQPMGGHAFLLAGYNEVGFLVQNSWGSDWGSGGYATLRYEDWLENAYDAWVARPGVPQTMFARPRQWTIPAPDGVISTVGPNLQRLPKYVVNVMAGGRLSGNGKVSSSPCQIDDLVTEMGVQHDAWMKARTTTSRHVVLYAHGGLVDENGGIRTADRMITWWLENHVYPIHIAWESGAPDTIISFLKGQLRELLPFGGPLDGIWERLDRTLEGMGRTFRPLWEEMKTNARLASDDLKPKPIDWGAKVPDDQPGVTLLIERLKRYRDEHKGEVKIHLVGHSAGSVVLAHTLLRLIKAGFTVESLQLMGGAITIEEFTRTVLPELQSRKLKRFAAYNLTDGAEQNDQCPGGPFPVYRKSLLYFVARSLERPANPAAMEVPMLGLRNSLNEPFRLPNGTMATVLDAIGKDNAVIAPNDGPDPVSRSRANGHGEFDDDPDTMTAVILRILERRKVQDVVPYPQGGKPSAATAGPETDPAVPDRTPPAASVEKKQGAAAPPMMAAAGPDGGATPPRRDAAPNKNPYDRALYASGLRPATTKEVDAAAKAKAASTKAARPRRTEARPKITKK